MSAYHYMYRNSEILRWSHVFFVFTVISFGKFCEWHIIGCKYYINILFSSTFVLLGKKFYKKRIVGWEKKAGLFYWLQHDWFVKLCKLLTITHRKLFSINAHFRNKSEIFKTSRRLKRYCHGSWVASTAKFLVIFHFGAEAVLP